MTGDLSIIVTNYNKPHDQLIECMDSIKAQTVRPKEVILVDDCSEDPRAHALATSIILPKNVGVAKARDIGFKMSTGRLILFMDSDDKLSPDFIEQCGKVISNADVAYPNYVRFGHMDIPKRVEAPSRVTPKYLLGRKMGILVTSMIKREVYESNGGFRDLPLFEDWDFWIRAMYNGYTFKKANTLLFYRQNQNSRNHAPMELKTRINHQITAPYTVKDGRMVKSDGR